MHCVVGRLGLFLYGFLFEFEAFFRWFVVLILHWFNHEEPTLLTAMFVAPRGGNRPRYAGRGATLVLHASWFNRSSWIRAKEITTIRVYGCRALTSPRISGFRPSMKVPKSCFSDQSSVWLDKCSNLVW
ncbi:hypothetical protein GW17_00058868 [Ensete ventricosum]|nr:hypothetical protein GW17_00058868 [Ensete ventricosum]